MAQSHSKFKFFSFKPGKDGRITSTARNSVKKFVEKAGVAVKSVGVEYVEETGSVLLSLGYSDKEKGYPVELTTIVIPAAFGPGFRVSALEGAFEAAAKGVKNVICHEFYVKGPDVHAVFLTRA